MNNDMRLKGEIALRRNLEPNSFRMLRFQATARPSFSGMPTHAMILYVDGKRFKRVTYGGIYGRNLLLKAYIKGAPKETVENEEKFPELCGLVRYNECVWIETVKPN